jgi:putative aminopeptidase FrvX
MLTNDLNYTKKILEKLLNTPSPSGYCHQIMNVIEDEVKALGYDFERTQKGNGLVTINPEIEGDALLISAHLDTLGAMVRSVKDNGMIRFTCVGGFTMESVEGEYCNIHTRDGRTITGTILNTKPSVHVFAEARTQKRDEDVMEIRLDKDVSSKEDTEKLGIQVGDYISFDPRVVFTEDGFIKSRHLDDKAGVATIMGALAYIKTKELQLPKLTKVMFSTFEEVGHGSSYIPSGIDTLLAIDMGAIGDDLSCSEKDVSICVKDSSGPYDYQMVGRLIEISKSQELKYALDVYPHYGSDASAALRGGNNIKTALIGPGIHASHTMERTHETALLGTLNLLLGYISEI